MRDAPGYCPYCGTERHNQGSNIIGKAGGHYCSKSPTDRHIIVSNPPYCVFCGS